MMRHRHFRWMVVVGLGAGMCVWTRLVAGQQTGFDDKPLWTTRSDSAAMPDQGGPAVSSFADLIARARPAVVAVHTLFSPPATLAKDPGPSAFPYDPWRLFPDVPKEERAQGMGTGFAIRADGYIVTNHHVIEGASKVIVRIEGLSQALTARVVGSDPRSDVALLKVAPPRPLPVLPLGSSEVLPIGAWVVAIGDPFGLTHVATKGIVSGRGRALGDLFRSPGGYRDFIQTDAAIDRGNSGGPLLNLLGEVVGVNTAINSRARGIGFALPVDLVKAVLPHLYKKGQLPRNYLGISVEEVTWEVAVSFGLEEARGAIVSEVKPDSPAQKAGIAKGDIILKFARHAVSGTSDMGWQAGTAEIGKPVEVEIWRAGRSLSLRLIPSLRVSEKVVGQIQQARAVEEEPARLGLVVTDLDLENANRCGLPKDTQGVVVLGCAGDAQSFGVRLGDVITEINGAPVSGKAQLDELVRSIPKSGMIRLYLWRQRSPLFVAFPKRW